MNLRRTVLSLALALGLMASIAAPVALADTQDDNDGNNELTASVEVQAGGVFDAYFCDVAGAVGVVSGALGTVTLTSTSELTTVQPGALAICYDDTKPARPSFRTWISAGNFTSGSNTIPATGFKITRTWNVAQTQWSTMPGGTGGIGDIGFNGPAGLNVPDVPANCPLCFATWTTANALNGWQYVQYGNAGKGTADGTGLFPTVWDANNVNTGAFGVIELALDIPVATPAGSYTSTVTLEVNFATP